MVALGCPTMTLISLDGSVCAANGEILLTKPTTVSVSCSYENPPPSRTAYNWSIDGTRLPQFTSNTALIPIPSGSHTVTCQAYIDTSAVAPSDTRCNCAESKSLNITVVGM